MSAAPSICHTWTPRHLPRPNSAQAPTPRPSERRGGPQEPVLRPAGSAGRRRGARRTGRPPWGGSPGSQAWRGLQTQTPGAGSQRSALNCPFPFFFQARTLKPYLGPVPTKQGGWGLVAGKVGATSREKLMLLSQSLPHPHGQLTRVTAKASGSGMWISICGTEFQVCSFPGTRGTELDNVT